jgi:hypothetical protein
MRGASMQQLRTERKVQETTARKLFAARRDSRQLASAQILAHLVDCKQRIV